MCGLAAIFPFAGISKKQKADLRNLFLWLGAINDDRGGHSWGVWGRDTAINKGTGYFINNVHHIKKIVAKWDVTGSNWMALHTRFATHGAKTKANAHPFGYDKVTLAHNGVLTVHGEVEGKIPDVDSDHFAKYLNETLEANPYDSFNDNFKKAVKDISGSIGLLMSDEVGNLRAYASMQELHYAAGDWGYAISSSKAHLENALEAAGVSYNILMDVPDDTLIAPWYLNTPDVYAPSMAYTAYAGKAKGWGSYDWKNYDTLAANDAYYNGTGSKPFTGLAGDTAVTGISGVVKVKSAEESARVFAGVHDLTDEDPYASYPGDEGASDRAYEKEYEADEDFRQQVAMANTKCELCGTRPLGFEPATWVDPESQRVYLTCPDCAAMFHEYDEEVAAEAGLSDGDLSQMEALVSVLETQ